MWGDFSLGLSLFLQVDSSSDAFFKMVIFHGPHVHTPLSLLFWSHNCYTCTHNLWI